MDQRESIIKKVKDEDIQFIRMQFTDIFGAMKNVAITPAQLEKAMDNKIMFDGSSIDGFVRIEESDMVLYPDLNSFTIHPWGTKNGKVARFICDIYTPDHKPFEGDPRYILKKARAHAEKLGYTFNVGPECEFFLFKNDENGNPSLEITDTCGYFDLGPNDIGEDARKDIVLALEHLGFEVEASHHEVAPAQASCKAAVKGGNKLSFAEADSLISKLMTLNNPYNCPHGRPTIISMSKTELEKKFKRIV